MNQQTQYDVVATLALAGAGVAASLAAVGIVLIQPLNAAAAALCSIVFFIPGLYFLAFARRLRARDVALSHAAAFAASRAALDPNDLATELAVSRDDAAMILRTAVREGHLRGRFDERGWFIAEGGASMPEERRP